MRFKQKWFIILFTSLFFLTGFEIFGNTSSRGYKRTASKKASAFKKHRRNYKKRASYRSPTRRKQPIGKNYIIRNRLGY